MQRRFRAGTSVVVLVAALACATTQSLRRSRGEGTARFYEASFEELWAAAVDAVHANGLRLDVADDFDRFVAATHPPERTEAGGDEAVAVGAQQGERIGIFVDSVAPGVWSVEVVTKRRFVLDPNKLGWAEDIFYVIEQRLGDARVEPPPNEADATDDDSRAGGAAGGG